MKVLLIISLLYISYVYTAANLDLYKHLIGTPDGSYFTNVVIANRTIKICSSFDFTKCPAGYVVSDYLPISSILADVESIFQFFNYEKICSGYFTENKVNGFLTSINSTSNAVYVRP